MQGRRSHESEGETALIADAGLTLAMHAGNSARASLFLVWQQVLVGFLWRSSRKEPSYACIGARAPSLRISCFVTSGIPDLRSFIGVPWTLNRLSAPDKWRFRSLGKSPINGPWLPWLY